MSKAAAAMMGIKETVNFLIDDGEQEESFNMETEGAISALIDIAIDATDGLRKSILHKQGMEAIYQGIQDMADRAGWEVNWRYSGRAMYGKTCVGVIADNPVTVIERMALLGLTGAKMDDMGRSSIVYWPDLKTPENWQERSNSGDDDE